jgi:hypothetical protein
MKVLYYYNWNGTIKSMMEYEKEVKAHWDKVKGVKILGMYTPSIAWNRAWLFETDSVDKLFANSGVRNDNVRNTDMIFLLE